MPVSTSGHKKYLPLFYGYKRTRLNKKKKTELEDKTPPKQNYIITTKQTYKTYKQKYYNYRKLTVCK